METLKITVEVQSDTIEPTPETRTHYVGTTAVEGWAVFELDNEDAYTWPLSDLAANAHSEFDREAPGVNPCIRLELIEFGSAEFYAIAALEGFSENDDAPYARRARLDPGVEADLRSARDWLDRYRGEQAETR